MNNRGIKKQVFVLSILLILLVNLKGGGKLVEIQLLDKL
jgi:hypothetical protein